MIGTAAQVAGPVTGFERATRPDSLDAFAPAAGDGGLQPTPGAPASDGIPDVLLGPNSGSRPVRLLSGVDGSELASGHPFGAAFTGGVRVAYADLTGDGVPDPITAMGNGGGLVRLYDGATFANFVSGYPFGAVFAGGVHVAAGDVSGDGRADVIVAQGSAGGEVRIYNAADATLLAHGAPFGPSYMGGVRVASGDVNNDGRADVIVAQASGGTVSVFSGVDQTLLVSGQPYGPGFSGGIFVATGDVNADNHADIIIAPGVGNGPVMVVDGRTYAVLSTFPAYVPLFVGGVRVATADLTGDGRADIITAPGALGLPLLQVFDGATFNLVAQAFAYDPLFLGGVFVAGPSSSGRVRFTSAATTTFTIGEAGTFQITTMGTPPATTVTQTGALPDGVTFTDNGNGTATLAGTPTAGSGGTYGLTLTASNGVGPDVTQTFSLEVVDTAPQVTATTPANGATNVAFEAPLVVTFSEPVNVGAGAFTLECPAATPVPVTVLTASPAAQFTLDPNVDLPPTVTCTLRVDSDLVTDADVDDPPDTLAADFVASFTTSACAAITVSPTTVAGGNVTIAYTPVTFTQVGGVEPISWSVTSGSLPPGLTLAASTGVLSGTPTTAGPFSFTVTATSSTGCTGSAPLTLNIAAGPNHAPSFVAGPPQTTNEDSGAQSVSGWATSISPGPADEAAQIVGFNVTGNTNPALFSAGPAVSSTGALTYMPAANANGVATITLVAQDNGGTALGGVDTSAPQSFTITVNAVNDVPSFTLGTGPTVLENVGQQTFPGLATGLSAGPADEAGQTFTFAVTGNTNPTLFAVPPVVSSTGELTFEAASITAGTATITLTLQDSGGTALGGVDTSAPKTFTITVTGVNSAPSFTKGADQTVNEDSGAQTVAEWAKSISPGPPDEADQTVAFNVTGNSNPSLFSAAPAVSPTGDLTYTPAANANGSATIMLAAQDDGGTANGGIDSSPAQSFVINVNAVNDAPSFTKGGDQTVFENSGTHTVPGWATALSVGPTDEAGQTLTFSLENTNPGLFNAGPVVSSSGALAYTLAPSSAGTATITLTLKDSGGTALGGVDTSAPQTFTITVTAVNDAPSFTVGPNDSVLEDSGPRTVTPWATAISPGPGDESSQTVTFNVTGNTNSGLFSAGPAVSPTGVLTYTPAANASGVATITVALQDDGGTAGGGDDTSDGQTFTITITEVNDAPSFVASINPSSAEDAGAQSLSNWASSISRGPASEAGQTLTFSVTGNTNTALFAAGGAPAVSSTGTLTYTSALNAFGTAQITLLLQDNGGTANGGADTSAPQVFTITVTPVNDPPTVVNETFEMLGNTELHVDRTPGTTPSTSETTSGPTAYLGVLDNDSDPEGDPFAVTTVVGCGDLTVPLDCTLPSGAVLHLESNGAFSFLPPPGAMTANFIYNVADTPAAGVTASTSGTVTFTFVDLVWYVDGDAAAPGTGTSIAPFNSFTATNLNGVGGAGDLDGDDDYIFVFDSTLGSGIRLERGQRLISQFAGLSIPVSLNSNPSPTVVVAAGGARSVINGPVTMGNAIPREIRGFALSSGGDAINLTTSATMIGTAPLGLTIANNQFNAAAGEGIDVAMNAGTAGTLTLQVTGNSWDPGSTHVGNAVNINHTAGAGNLVLDISGNSNIKSNNAGIFIDGGNAADTRVASFAGNTVSGDTGGAGVSVQNVAFDADPGPASGTVIAGDWTIGADGNGVGGTALAVTASEGSLAFGQLRAYGANGLNLSGAGTGLGVGASSGGNVIKSTAGKAVQTSNLVLALHAVELVSSGADAGVSLSSTSGSITTTSNSSITKSSSTGTAFSVANSEIAFTYSGSLTVTAGSGVSLSSNLGSTITFSGGVSLSTGTNAAFTASGGGVVIVTDPAGPAANTIVTTSGTALSVTSTVIGTGGLVFQSIAANGAANGIVLNNTGTTAGLTVTGTGSNNSGGVIQNTTGDAVLLTTTRNVSLSEMRLFSAGQSNIDATTVNGLTLNSLELDLSVEAGLKGNVVTNLVISGGTFDRGGADAGVGNVHGVDITNLLGASTVTGATFSRSNTVQFRVNNTITTGSPDTLTVSGTTWNNHLGPNAGDHLSVSADTGGNFKLVTNASAGENNFQTGGIGVQATANGSGTMQASITGVQTSGNTAGVVVAATAASNLRFNVFDNTTANGTGFSSTGTRALVMTCTQTATCQGAFTNNSIDHTAGPGVEAMAVSLEGNGTGIVTVANNVISGDFSRGLRASVGSGTGSGNLSLNVTGNNLTGTATAAQGALQVFDFASSLSGDDSIVNTMCLNLANNVATIGSGMTAYRFVARDQDVFRLQNFTGDGSDLADVQAWVTTVKANSGTPITASFVDPFLTSAACATPVLPTP